MRCAVSRSKHAQNALYSTLTEPLFAMALTTERYPETRWHHRAAVWPLLAVAGIIGTGLTVLALPLVLVVAALTPVTAKR